MAKSILVIDDSASLRQVVKLALLDAGYQVIEAGDGDAAVAMLDGRNIDMAVCDVGMPELNGFEFGKAPKAIKATSAKAWICKPFAPASLLSAVNKLCPL